MVVSFACARRLSRKRRPSALAAGHSELVEQLITAARELQALRCEWDRLDSKSSGVALENLRSRESELRDSVEDCEFGDPADTFMVPWHTCTNQLVAAHSTVTKAVVQLELARLCWEVQNAELLGHSRRDSPEVDSFVESLLDMAVLELRLMNARGAYEILSRISSFGDDAATNPRVLDLSYRVVTCQMMREPHSMSGEDISRGSQGEALLHHFGEVLLESGYTAKQVLESTGAESMIEFSNADLAAQFEANLLERRSGEIVQASLVDLIRVFLLHRLLPMVRLLGLVGHDCCQLLIRLQVVSVLKAEGCQLVSVEMAAKMASSGVGLHGLLCFSNIKIWPVEQNLLIATDDQDWPFEGFEPVMYLSDDSFALVHAAPRTPVRSVLDLCCGSGVQGIVALRYYAEAATFVDLNPRALHFVRFNLALNKLGHKTVHLHHGSLYAALPDGAGPYDAILANPPFLPNPQGIASQAIAMFGNGGDLGEQVLAEIVQGASTFLTPTGTLASVTYAPNVDSMAQRVEAWLKAAGALGCQATVFGGELRQASDFSPVASEVEARCYVEALQALGIETLSEAITVVRILGDISEEPRVDFVGPCEALFDNEPFLRQIASDDCSTRS